MNYLIVLLVVCAKKNEKKCKFHENNKLLAAKKAVRLAVHICINRSIFLFFTFWHF